MNKINWDIEKLNIEKYLDNGKSVKEIADIYGVSTGTIYNKISDLVRERRKFYDAEKWQMWNEILNLARNIVGKEMVSPTTNPYI